MYLSPQQADVWEARIPTEKIIRETIAALLVEEMQQFIPFSEEMRFKIEFCLQEGLQNAAVHGNLGVTMPLLSLEDFERAQELIERRLTISPFNQRQVQFVCRLLAESLELNIKDEGKGFSLAETKKETLFGRGFILMTELSDGFSYCQETTTLQILFKKLS
jgi:anti-sigma regulatory factor (Ser/Thr protein kinase)